MCNVPLISILFIAAQLSFAVAMGLVATAGALNASLFMAGKAPFYLVAAVVFLGAAVASLRVAYKESINCFPTCPTEVQKVVYRSLQLISALTALGIAVAAATVLASIPFAAVLAISLTLAASLVVIVLFFIVGLELVALATCAATRPVPLPATTIIAGVLGVFLAIVFGGLIITGIVAGLIPLVPLPLG
jgi:L-cystine uptake protein TcyP (sodium:dicarboxylate symporter family)